MALDLATAAALILALGFLQGFNTRLRRRLPFLAQTLTGLVFGAMCIIGLLMPIQVHEGVLFDARTVVLSLAGLYGGVWPGLLAGAMAMVARLYLGGVGAEAGVLIIISSVVLGVAYRYWLRGHGGLITAGRLFLFGLVVNTLATVIFLILPASFISLFYPGFAVGFVLFMSVATVLLGLILRNHEERESTQDALSNSESRLRAINAASPDISLVIDEDGLIHEAIVPCTQLLPSGTQDLHQQPLEQVFPPELAEQFRQCVRQALEQREQPPIFVYTLETAGGCRSFEARARSIDTPVQERRAVLVLARDVTERDQAEAELRVAAKAFESQQGMVVTDASNRILRVNQAFTCITGYSAEEVIGQSTRMLSSGLHDPAFHRNMQEQLKQNGSWEGEVVNRQRNGSLYPARLALSSVVDQTGAVTHYVGSLLDLTQTKEAEAEIRSLALFDQLTSLPNRRQLTERLHNALHHGDAARRGALLFIDLDDFKNINDLYNHHTGDLLLQQVAQRLRALLEPDHMASRFGADEFVVLLDPLPTDPAEAHAFAERVGQSLLESVRRPFLLERQFRQISASIGITLFDGRGHPIDELLLQADLAMHEAKRRGKGRLHFFDPAMQHQVTARLQLEDSIRHGIRRQEFMLFYQPQVDGQGRLAGAEALARWPHPERGMVSPGDFIPAAEAAGLMPELGKALLRQVCQQLAAWQEDPLLADVRVAINLSVTQIFEPDFVESLLGILAATGAPAHRLVLEITESLLLNDLDDAQGILQRLRGHGVRFSIDDFGTGYSSLAYLQRLPLNELKIDRSFVSDLPDNASSVAIVRMILALADALGLDVVAEGVETDAQWESLRREGCPHFQGFLFAKPLAPAEFVAWVQARESVPVVTP